MFISNLVQSVLPTRRTDHPLDFLDGWRGFATMLVLFHHCSTSGLLRIGDFHLRGIGGPGVAMFFVLSAFLLSRNIVLSRSNVFDPVFLQSFYVRRVMRIYPLFIVYLLLALATSFILVQMTGQERGLPFYLTIPEFLEHMVVSKGYGVTWTLAVEIKYYLLLPFLTVLFLWLARINIGLVAAAAAAFYVGYFALGYRDTALPGTTTLWPFIGVFVLGSALGVILSVVDHDRIRQTCRSGAMQALLATLWIAAIVLTFVQMPVLSRHFDVEIFRLIPNMYYNSAFLFGVIIVTTLYGPKFLGWFFERPFMRYLGVISFSIYLIHTLYMSVFKKLLPVGVAEFGWLIVVPLSLLTAHISYRLIEEPTMALRPRRFLFNRT